MKSRKQLYIIYGGPSSEREVSFSSKDYFLNLYKDKKPILVEWLTNFRFKVFLDSNYSKNNLEFKEYSENAFYKYLSIQACVVVIAGHGEYMEDGYLQEKLALNKIEFTGSTATSCKLAMNKYYSAQSVKNIVDIIPTYRSLVKDFNKELLTKYVGKFPIFIKPNCKGSSVGCFKVNNIKELASILSTLDPNEEYLFQKIITGTEVSVGAVSYGVNKIIKLPPTEIKPIISNYFSYDAKYKDGGSIELTPAEFTPALNNKISNLAFKIHKTLGLGFYSRSDFLITKDLKIYYLETNSLPGMSKNSILPKELSYTKNILDFKKGLIKYTVKPFTKSKKILNVPYQSQFTLVSNNNLARDNGWRVPNKGFKISGALSIEDYKEYSHHICGSACVKMILEYFNIKQKNLFTVFYALNKLGLYTDTLNLNYSNLTSFCKPLGINSKTYLLGLGVDEIIKNILNDIPVVISINTLNSNIKYADTGGHLVVVTGFSLSKKCLYVNDPSGNNKKLLTKNRPLSFDDYYNLSSCRGFIIY